MNLIPKYHSGEYLSDEQHMALESSMLILQKENQLNMIHFWGKINGIQQDYFIVRGYNDDYFKNIKFYYSPNLMDWTLLPKVKDQSSTRACNFHFTGIPSHVFEILMPSENDELKVVSLKEEDRLSATVEIINKEANIIPRGAFHTLSDGRILKNSSFEGMTEVEALDLKSYIHCEDLRRNDEPFPYWTSKNTIELDYPPGSWSLHTLQGGQVVSLQSLIWPGYCFYYQPNSPHYNCMYYGDGRKNLDLYLML